MRRQGHAKSNEFPLLNSIKQTQTQKQKDTWGFPKWSLEFLGVLLMSLQYQLKGGSPVESQSKPGTNMVDPEPRKEIITQADSGGFWLGLSLTFSCRF